MKILILSTARTGSSYLINLLQKFAIKNTCTISEPFGMDMEIAVDKDKHIRKTIKKIKKVDNIILKTHFNQVNELHEKKYKDFFLNNEIWYKILLLRKDLFRCTYSHAVADTIGNFGDKTYKNLTVTIDKNKFLDILEDKIFYWTEFSKIKSQGEYNKIVYFEDLSFNNEEDYKKLEIPLEKTIQNKYIISKEKTAYNKLTITNKEELQEIFHERIKEFSYTGIKNNNGILELE
jgi:hypothetical protein